MGGVKNSFHAYLNVTGSTPTTTTLPVCKPSADKKTCLSDQQLFFVAYAQGWCAKETTNEERILQSTDPHSPPQFRVQGPLQNFPTFAQVFDCPVGSTYNPTSRCEVW
jgi:predicted metalloendopeptidase